MKRKKSTK